MQRNKELYTDIWQHQPLVHCIPNRANLTIGSCRTNQQEALKGASQLLSGCHVALIPEHQLERLMACGNCEHCGVDLRYNRVKRVLGREAKRLMDDIESVDWYAKDNEVRALRERAYWKMRYQERKES